MPCPIFQSDSQGIIKAAQIILQGGVIAFPTETFYGLAAEAGTEAALKKIFRAKGREEGKPLLLLVADHSWLQGLVQGVPPLAERLIKKFWPGPLTLVFEASSQLSPLLTANTGKIGIRVSSHPVAQALVRAVGRPITGTSANLSGQPSTSTAEEVFQSLGTTLEAILDGGKTAGGLGSTVLDVSGSPPRILREGVIPEEELRVFSSSRG
jgi:L-threonylcarbamoyladenylate synthase